LPCNLHLYKKERKGGLDMPKVLISDKMAPKAAEIFKDKGVDVDVITGQSPEELKSIIGQYDGLAIRSSTKVTEDILKSATNLKVIGRAGIGVDNVDIPTATEKGVIVMNTPFGNSVTTAEHTISMMMALARSIPQANASTHAGKWEKSKFMGVELFNKTLGVIGCGNIGAIVIDRALGLKMKVVGFDPYLTDERAVEMGIEKVDLDTLYARADFITLHVPKTDKTAGMINKDAFTKMKDGVRIMNVARGGLIVETDLLEALNDGKVAGAALDVFEEEPAKENTLFGHENVICTPHLGASTIEAQDNVAIQVAEQIADYLVNGAIVNALNMPSITAEDAPKLKPYLALSEQIGLMMGQITDSAIQSIKIEFLGKAAGLNTKPLTAMIVASVLKQSMAEVNMVSAPAIAQSRGIDIATTENDNAGELITAIRLKIKTETREKEITGTLFAGRDPRIVSIDGVPVEAVVSPSMLFIRNDDTPGLIGGIGTILGQAGVNIADFRLGRIDGKKEAVALVSIDGDIANDVMEQLGKLDSVQQLKALKF
jgi:D-3-phosphoglycerate dehydrogenase